MSTVPMHRRGTTDDIGKAALFFLSDLSTYVSGQTLAVDGGFTAVGPIDYTANLPLVLSRPGWVAERVEYGAVEERVHLMLSTRLREIFDLFGQLPDVFEDVWVEVALSAREKANALIDAVPRHHLFEIRYHRVDKIAFSSTSRDEVEKTLGDHGPMAPWRRSGNSVAASTNGRLGMRGRTARFHTRQFVLASKTTVVVMLRRSS